MGAPYRDYTRFLSPTGLKGARIGVTRNFNFDERTTKLLDECLIVMKKLGAEIIDPTNLDTAEKVREPEQIVEQYEIKDGLKIYSTGSGLKAPVHTLADIIAFNEKNKVKVMPYFGQERMIEAEKRGPLTDEVYLNAQRERWRLSREEGIDGVMKKHNLDAIVAVTGGMLDNRPGQQRRPQNRRQLYPGSDGRLSEHYCSSSMGTFSVCLSVFHLWRGHIRNHR